MIAIGTNGKIMLSACQEGSIGYAVVQEDWSALKRDRPASLMQYGSLTTPDPAIFAKKYCIPFAHKAVSTSFLKRLAKASRQRLGGAHTTLPSMWPSSQIFLTNIWIFMGTWSIMLKHKHHV